jgi:thiamine biosynthesis lipoprotein
MKRSTFDAIGTRWDITSDDDLSDATWGECMQRVSERIEQFDVVYSRFREDSLVTKMSQQAGTYPLPADGYRLLKCYEQLYKATAHKVTPLIGNTLADAGYDAAYSFRPKPLSSPYEWADVLTYDQSSLTVSQPVVLDFGAAGKGYLIDIISQLMDQTGISNHTINAGGDIIHRSSSGEDLTVGLQNPVALSEVVAITKISNKSLCASAGSKRKWGTFHHIIDPKALKSPMTILATWAIARDTLTADGIATALFFTDAVSLQKTFTFSYAVLYADMSFQHSNDFPITTFENEALVG